MLSYLMAIHFVLFGNSTDLKKFWKAEVIRRDNMTIWRLLREKRSRSRNYLFWWRLANEMFIHGGELTKKAAKKINRRLLNEYGCDLGLGLTIGKGLTILHHTGIVVTSTAIIGDNLTIRQNTTIGRSQSCNEHDHVIIGNNVDIGAHCFILGSGFTIGDNVKIGAMSFINKDIPSNCTYITKKSGVVLYK
ncbi:TPA: serine acetyltransferase [Escherichia coli]|uniref:Serine acetyltransferase n=1 Tax=Escherichia coli TaxID=562 RepID=A0A6L6ZNZ4_ECOLX|nr:serine acetyltransferase [Escherichia coli]EFC5375561.1 serine acetyltransferase [Escherichia coli]EJG7544807.1 serine acetyltransferase [Escherichia coli]EKK2770525.1 serine acetyltransferase [Escherichia coli]MWL45194.1 serine acetyltransferase [Escherichia coli]MWU49242.1 serine acetyltransferase [Escherichia coli]